MRKYTLASDFEFQVEEIMEKFREEVTLKENEEEVTHDTLWDNRELLGGLFYEAVCNYCGFEDFGIEEEE